VLHCLLTALSAVAEYTRDKDHNADISNLFLTKEYYPGQPVELQLFHVDLRNPEASTLQPMVFAVPDMFLAKDGMGFTIDVQGKEDRLLQVAGGGVYVRPAWPIGQGSDTS
jgi:hypothetical protein